MDAVTPARLYCLLVGGALVAAGLLGFFYESGFGRGDELRSGEILGIFEVNGWHNVVHLAIGLALLGLAGGSARPAALIFGGIYAVVAILGLLAVGGSGIGFLAERDVIAEVIPVNSADNFLHLVLGATGVIAGYGKSGVSA